MRKLNAQQKKVLDREYSIYNARSSSDISPYVWVELERINCFENMYTSVDIYLGEKELKAIHIERSW